MIAIRKVAVPVMLVLAGLGIPASKPAVGVEPVQVRIARYRFQPEELTVAPGTSVRWVNEDDDPHTVTSDTGAFGSRGIDTREEFTFTFTAPGRYGYHCSLHPMMQGVVIVR